MMRFLCAVVPCALSLIASAQTRPIGPRTLTDRLPGATRTLSQPHNADTPGAITTIAGAVGPSSGLGADIGLRSPFRTAVDANGNVYFSDDGDQRVWKLTPSGTMTVAAGNGTPGFSGDGGPATSAQLFYPTGVAVDGGGNLYIADTINNRIRKVTTTGVISTVAGTGAYGFSGDGGSGTAARLASPYGVALDGAGNLYIADTENSRIRMVNTSGIISTVAGGGFAGFSGDNGSALSAQLSSPRGVAVDNNRNIYVADTGNHRIRKVAGGIITTVAGTVTGGFSGDGTTAVTARLSEPSDVAVDPTGILYIADSSNQRLRKVDLQGIISTVAGAGTLGYSGEGSAIAAQLCTPSSVALDNSGNIFFADACNHRIRKVTPAGIISTVAGDGTGGFGPEGPAANSRLAYPGGVAVDAAGNVFVADTYNQRIRKITSTGAISTVAGITRQGFSGDGGPATEAQLALPYAVAVDNDGSLYIADVLNSRVRKVNRSGLITTYAGSANAGYAGDGGLATSAWLAAPIALALDSTNNLYIADLLNCTVRKVTPAGIITTIAGTGTAGFSGDGGVATRAQLNGPTGVTVDAAGNVYISDTVNNRIRKVTPAGIISTIAGNGTPAFTGDGGPASAATINQPVDLKTDAAGNLYFVERVSSVVRKISPSNVISTVAGTGFFGLSGDGGPATSAQLYGPQGIAFDSAGNLYIGDTQNHRIRKVTAGSASGSGGGGSASGAPVITGGPVNAASYARSDQPNGGIARGSLFVIFGTGLGPSAIQVVSSLPLLPSLGGTSVQVQVGGRTVDALLVYSIATQVGAILPSNTPAGQGTLTVTYQGQASATVPIRVVDASFGIFTQTQTGSGAAVVQNAAADGSLTLNTPGQPAAPGSVAVIWGTGLGPVNGNDAAAPLPGDLGSGASVLVGGKSAAILYQGRSGCCIGIDQIAFRIPDGVTGCEVTLQIQVGGVTSNSTSIAIAPSGTACSANAAPAPVDLSSLKSRSTLRAGSIGVANLHYLDQGPLTPVSDINVASASFVTTTGADYFGAQGAGLAVDIQPGTCRTATWAYDLATLLSLRQPAFLDAGLGLQLDAPNGRFAMTAPTGQYTYTSTGPFPVGKYKVSGSGGRNVGPFSIDTIVPEPLNWTNSNISTVSRDRDLTITWASGKTDGLITITGITIADTLGLFGGAFSCIVSPADGRFTVPSSILKQIPASAPLSFSTLAVAVYSPFTVVTSGVNGLDILTAVGGSVTLKNVLFQ